MSLWQTLLTIYVLGVGFMLLVLWFDSSPKYDRPAWWQIALMVAAWPITLAAFVATP